MPPKKRKNDPQQNDSDEVESTGNQGNDDTPVKNEQNPADSARDIAEWQPPSQGKSSSYFIPCHRLVHLIIRTPGVPLYFLIYTFKKNNSVRYEIKAGYLHLYFTV